jgi:hypothetical protein
MPRTRFALFTLLIATAAPAAAQDAGPLALLLPVSARPAALGNAWVAGRDEYAVFSNPGAVAATTGFNISLGTYGSDTRTLAAVSGTTVGPATIGWGVHLVDFSTSRTDPGYPFAPAKLTGGGDSDNFSMVALVAARITKWRFNIGAAAKYAQDIAPRETSGSSLLVVPERGNAVLLDLGTTHALWTGTAGLAVQNIGEPYRMGGRYVSVPTQIALGWTKVRGVGPLDATLATQATLRRGGWVGVGGGLDLSWNWVEGYTVGARIGARRTETAAEQPVALGAMFNADRLNIEYAIGFFDGDKNSHRLTLRWR